MKKILFIAVCCLFSITLLTGCFSSDPEETLSTSPSPTISATPTTAPTVKPSATPKPSSSISPTPKPSSSTTPKPSAKSKQTAVANAPAADNPTEESPATEGSAPTPTPAPTPDRRAEYEAELSAIEAEYARRMDIAWEGLHEAYGKKRMAELERWDGTETTESAIQSEYLNDCAPYKAMQQEAEAWRESAIAALNAKYGY